MTNEAKILTGIGVATLLIVIGAAFLFGGSSSPTKESTKITEDQSKILVRETSHIKGAADAKVTLVEFGDFQCPACGAVHPVVDTLLKEYEGKVKFVYRQFPLAIHQNAKAAAYAAEAAGAQGKFFEMYDALFQNQKDWESGKDAMKMFEEYADVVGLDVEKFKQDIADKKFEEVVQKDINDGYSLGINSTPTFFLNGEKMSGGLPYDQFKAKIDAALK